MYADTEMGYMFDEYYILLYTQHIRQATWSAWLPVCLLSGIRMCKLRFGSNF